MAKDVFVAVVPFDSRTSNGTLDVTSARLGLRTPKAAIVILTGNAVVHADDAGGALSTGHVLESVGFTDGTTHLCNATTAVTNVAASDVFRDQATNLINQIGSAGTAQVVASFSTWLANGIRVNFTTTAATAYRGLVILFAGADLSAKVNNQALGTGTSALTVSPGIAPTLIFAKSSGAANASGVESFFLTCFGITHWDGTTLTQKAFGITGQDAIAAGDNPNQVMSSNRGLVCATAGSAAASWDLTMSNVTASTFDVTPSASAGNDDAHFLTVSLSDVRAKLWDFAAPGTNGSASYTEPGFKPQFGMGASVSQTARDTFSYDAAITYRHRLTAFDGVNNMTAGFLMSGNADPTSSSHLCWGPTQVFQTGADANATLTSFDATGWTLNWTSTVAVIAFALAIEEGGAFLDKTLGPVTCSATGTLGITGATTKTLGALAADGDANLAIGGATASTLGAVTLDGDGSANPNEGALNKALDAVTATAAGALPITGAAAKTLAPVTGAATGTLGIAATAANTLGDVTLDADGAMGGNAGSVNATLGDVTAAAAGDDDGWTDVPDSAPAVWTPRTGSAAAWTDLSEAATPWSDA